MPQFRAGMRFGSWIILEFVDGGGNAEVWTARRDDEQVWAIKVLKGHDPTSEPFQRFANEITILEQLRGIPGVMPLVEWGSEPQTGQRRRLWYVMPLAQKLREHLGDTPPLADVVAAIGSIAVTLADIAEAHGVSHRDIKPENLFWLDDRFVIGDFGLAEAPDLQKLTEAGKPLGSRHYLAPEMTMRPLDADGHAADVYSLAKTLWVLAADQNFPLPGEQRIDTPALTVSGNSTDPRAISLDWLLQDATRTDPTERPNLRQFAAYLSRWADGLTDDKPSLDAVNLAIRRNSDKVERLRQEAEQRVKFAKMEMNRAMGNVQVFLDAIAQPEDGRSWSFRYGMGVPIDLEHLDAFHQAGRRFTGRRVEVSLDSHEFPSPIIQLFIGMSWNVDDDCTLLSVGVLLPSPAHQMRLGASEPQPTEVFLSRPIVNWERNGRIGSVEVTAFVDEWVDLAQKRLARTLEALVSVAYEETTFEDLPDSFDV